MTTTRTLFVALAILWLCGGTSRAADEKNDWRGLSNQKELPEKYREAAVSVAAVLRAEKEDPREFKAQVEERERGRVYVFHLWHKSAFEAANKDAIGNPGGRCRDIMYDAKKRTASASLFWQ